MYNCNVAAFSELKLDLHNRYLKFFNAHSQYYALPDFNSELTPEKDKIQVAFMVRKPLAYAISQISDIENDRTVGIRIMQNWNNAE